MRTVTLGRTGIRTSVLAVGTGTRGWAGSSAQTQKGDSWLTRTLLEGVELGITFWDLADQYGSHPAAAAALKSLDRESVVIATKTTESAEAPCAGALERFLRELGTEYLDIVLLHDVTSRAWNRRSAGAMAALEQAKRAGRVRAVGVSVHSLAALRTAAAEPWVDVILARLNYSGVNMDALPDKVLPVLGGAREAGKAVYAMKVLGCGVLTADPNRAIRYVAGSGAADALTIGPTEDGHLRDLARFVDAAWPR